MSVSGPRMDLGVVVCAQAIPLSLFLSPARCLDHALSVSRIPTHDLLCAGLPPVAAPRLSDAKFKQFEFIVFRLIHVPRQVISIRLLRCLRIGTSKHLKPGRRGSPATPLLFLEAAVEIEQRAGFFLS